MLGNSAHLGLHPVYRERGNEKRYTLTPVLSPVRERK
jgi:hypothetical protein